MRFSRAHYLTFLGVLLFVNALLVVAFLYTPHTLRVSFLDVGQGDAILIEGPTGIDLLIDGGRDRSALRELGKHLSPLHRTIDLVAATHPDADHIGGLPAVFSTYAVHGYLSSRIESETGPSKALAAAVAAEPGIATLVARRGERIDLGGGAYADVLFPDRDVDHLETNTGSLVLHVVYGDTSFMLTGDLPDEVEDWLVTLNDGELKSDVLKAGHHGSRTSTDDAFLAAVDPKVVVISAGKDNSYGHPHPETLERIQASGASVLSTIDSGTITLVSDGVTVRQR